MWYVHVLITAVNEMDGVVGCPPVAPRIKFPLYIYYDQNASCSDILPVLYPFDLGHLYLVVVGSTQLSIRYTPTAPPMITG